jgi:hypothetical protein
MNSFSGEGKYLGNNIPRGRGKVEQEQQVQNEKLSPNVKRIQRVDSDIHLLQLASGVKDTLINAGFSTIKSSSNVRLLIFQAK